MEVRDDKTVVQPATVISSRRLSRPIYRKVRFGGVRFVWMMHPPPDQLSSASKSAGYIRLAMPFHTGQDHKPQAFRNTCPFFFLPRHLWMAISEDFVFSFSIFGFNSDSSRSGSATGYSQS